MNRSLPALACAAACAAWLAGCAGSNAFLAQPLSRKPEPELAATLYARDGTPVEADHETPRHAPQDGGESRMYLLELYQEAVDRREALEGELEALGAELAHTRGEVAARDAALTSSSERERALIDERDRLAAEKEDLAARLVTAQIRRLEAEKLLLEAKIEWLRAEDAHETAPTSSTPADTGDRR